MYRTPHNQPGQAYQYSQPVFQGGLSSQYQRGNYFEVSSPSRNVSFSPPPYNNFFEASSELSDGNNQEALKKEPKKKTLITDEEIEKIIEKYQKKSDSNELNFSGISDRSINKQELSPTRDNYLSTLLNKLQKLEEETIEKFNQDRRQKDFKAKNPQSFNPVSQENSMSQKFINSNNSSSIHGSLNSDSLLRESSRPFTSEVLEMKKRMLEEKIHESIKKSSKFVSGESQVLAKSTAETTTSSSSYVRSDPEPLARSKEYPSHRPTEQLSQTGSNRQKIENATNIEKKMEETFNRIDKSLRTSEETSKRAGNAQGFHYGMPRSPHALIQTTSNLSEGQYRAQSEQGAFEEAFDKPHSGYGSRVESVYLGVAGSAKTPERFLNPAEDAAYSKSEKMALDDLLFAREELNEFNERRPSGRGPVDLKLALESDSSISPTGEGRKKSDHFYSSDYIQKERERLNGDERFSLPKSASPNMRLSGSSRLSSSGMSPNENNSASTQTKQEETRDSPKFCEKGEKRLDSFPIVNFSEQRSAREQGSGNFRKEESKVSQATEDPADIFLTSPGAENQIFRLQIQANDLSEPEKIMTPKENGRLISINTQINCSAPQEEKRSPEFSEKREELLQNNSKSSLLPTNFDIGGPKSSHNDFYENPAAQLNLEDGKIFLQRNIENTFSNEDQPPKQDWADDYQLFSKPGPSQNNEIFDEDEELLGGKGAALLGLKKGAAETKREVFDSINESTGAGAGTKESLGRRENFFGRDKIVIEDRAGLPNGKNLEQKKENFNKIKEFSLREDGDGFFSEAGDPASQIEKALPLPLAKDELRAGAVPRGECIAVKEERRDAQADVLEEFKEIEEDPVKFNRGQHENQRELDFSAERVEFVVETAPKLAATQAIAFEQPKSKENSDGELLLKEKPARPLEANAQNVAVERVQKVAEEKAPNVEAQHVAAAAEKDQNLEAQKGQNLLAEKIQDLAAEKNLNRAEEHILNRAQGESRAEEKKGRNFEGPVPELRTVEGPPENEVKGINQAQPKSEASAAKKSEQVNQKATKAPSKAPLFLLGIVLLILLVLGAYFV